MKIEWRNRENMKNRVQYGCRKWNRRPRQSIRRWHPCRLERWGRRPPWVSRPSVMSTSSYSMSTSPRSSTWGNCNRCNAMPIKYAMPMYEFWICKAMIEGTLPLGDSNQSNKTDNNVQNWKFCYIARGFLTQKRLVIVLQHDGSTRAGGGGGGRKS